MSMSQSAVANKLRLLRLTYEEQNLILELGLTERHARAMLRIEESPKRIETIRFVAEQRLNVQDTELYVEEMLENEATMRKKCVRSEGDEGDFDVFRGEREMIDMVQTLRRRVDLWNKNGRNACIRVTNGAESVEVTIRFDKANSGMLNI